MSKPKINEDFLLLLIDNNGIIVTDTIAIVKHFENENKKLSELCGTDGTDNIDQIVSFIRKELQPKLPNKTFKYCKDLDKAYQSVHVNVENGIKTFLDRKDLIYTNQKLALSDEKEFDLDSRFKVLKRDIKEIIELWFKVFDIGFAYEKAKAIPNVLSYSHRISGWSSPEYQLSPNFSIEFKTNFGYGNSSYFFTKIKYKNIEITPLSDWVNYEIAKFSEIIRYTREYQGEVYRGTFNGVKKFKKQIKNSYWQNAMEFAMEACNCSRRSETEFIEKYVIEECEYMVEGLTDILTKSSFKFKRGTETYEVDKKGHQLIEFRAEKVSGAIDFISKIIEYNQIAEIQKFIVRIEQTNKKIQPIIIEEIKIIEVKLISLNKDFNALKPEYEKLKSKDIEYNKDLNKLRIEMINNKVFDYQNVDTEKLNQQFEQINPEYKDFVSEFKRVSIECNELVQKINILEKLKENIKSYQNKIENYFKKKLNSTGEDFDLGKFTPIKGW